MTLAAEEPNGRVGRPFTVVLDAAHGGADTGTTLAPQLFEKDVVLALSIHLRSALNARGIAVVTTREVDGNPSIDTRAAEANHARPAACIVLHATASGSGVHLYTSSSGDQAAAAMNGLQPWGHAGAGFTTDSLQLASDLGAAISSAGLPYTLGRVHLPPMDLLACPTVAVEVAPLHATQTQAHTADLADERYRQQLVGAIAAALVQWRAERPGGGAQ